MEITKAVELLKTKNVEKVGADCLDCVADANPGEGGAVVV
jgi:hypothetical protein